MLKDTPALLPGPQAVREDEPLWMASWANPYRCMEWIHRYVFSAPSQAAAQKKIDAWMSKPPCPLPAHTHMRARRLLLCELPEYPLDFWQFTWTEDGEFHTLILFGLDGRRAVCWRAREWVRSRHESREQLQLLRQLTRAERPLARFDPTEGVEVVGPL